MGIYLYIHTHYCLSRETGRSVLIAIFTVYTLTCNLFIIIINTAIIINIIIIVIIIVIVVTIIIDDSAKL